MTFSPRWLPAFNRLEAESSGISSPTAKWFMGIWVLPCLAMIPIYRYTKAEEYVAEREP